MAVYLLDEQQELTLQLRLHPEERFGVRPAELNLGARWTVASLEAALRAGRGAGRLVQLHEGSCGEHLFWVMPRVYDYRMLQCFSGSETVWGLSAGMDAIEEPADHIARLATAAIFGIRRVQEVGPYRMAAFCFGGYLAFEIANLLDRDGEEVRFTLVYRPGLGVRWRRWQRMNLPARYLRKLIGGRGAQSSMGRPTQCSQPALVWMTGQVDWCARRRWRMCRRACSAARAD